MFQMIPEAISAHFDRDSVLRHGKRAFVPCYVDQFYPGAAIATLELLEKLGCKVVYPMDQTCCGQPMANAGYEQHGLKTMRLFTRTFAAYEYIVMPSGSCALHVKAHYDPLEQTEDVRHAL